MPDKLYPASPAIRVSAREKTKPCRECFEPIRSGAKKCKTCGAYQDGRRFLAFGSTFLALLVALVSVLSLSIPIVSQALDGKDSNLNVLYQGAQKDKAYFLVTNSGSRDGTVNYVRLIVSTPVANFGHDDRVAVRFDVPPTTIPGGKSEQIVVPLSGDARALIDRTVYATWIDNVAKHHQRLPELKFQVGHVSFKEGRARVATFSPSLNDLLLAGPTEWYKCAGSIAWSDWNGPTSHFFPEDIDPDVAELYCGKLPPTFRSPPVDGPRPPRADVVHP